jgi:chitodextrinase
MQMTPARTNRMCGVLRPAGLLAGSVMAAAVLTGCQVERTEAPAPTGPSELGLAIGLRAVPDVVTMDGLSQSHITVTAHDANGRPAGNVAVRVEITAGGAIVDFGRLSTKNVVTGGDGHATLTYTAPAGAPSQNSDPGTLVHLTAVPAGYDYNNALAREVAIRLVPQGIILPQAFAPLPVISYSPTTIDEDIEVIFDASQSIAQCPDPSSPAACRQSGGSGGSITSYLWEFGDGKTGSGVQARTRYSVKGTYTVKLTVVNDRGTSNSVTTPVTVAEVSPPTADFSVSPQNPAVNQTVFFDASASRTAGAGRYIATYNWTFGDGGTGTGVQTSRRYANQGTYTVTLTIADSSGRRGTKSQSVTVGRVGE